MNRFRLALVGLALVVVACSGGSSSGNDVLGAQNSAGSGENGTGNGGISVTPTPSTPGTSPNPTPSPTGTETPGRPPTKPKLVVEASIVSATLGENCPEAKKPGPGAPGSDLCAGESGCGSFCRGSNLQLSFVTGEGTGIKVKVTSVTLVDLKTGAKVGDLKPSAPQVWKDNAYVPWDESLAPKADVKASYDLTSPAWDGMKLAFSAQFKLVVTLDLGGETEELTSGALTREPPVVT